MHGSGQYAPKLLRSLGLCERLGGRERKHQHAADVTEREPKPALNADAATGEGKPLRPPRAASIPYFNN